MDKLIEATISSINASGVAAPLVFVLICGCSILYATCRRLFTLYQAAMEARIVEKEAVLKTVAEFRTSIDRLSDTLRMGAK
jgi:hypothetical protein